MDRSTPIKLIAESYAADSYGVLQKTRTKREVYANVRSVTASEWFEGGRSGLNPEYRFTLFAPDYQGEKVLEFDGKEYSVIRVDWNAQRDGISLICEERVRNG